MLDRMIAEIFVAVFEVDVEAFGRLIRPEIRQAFGLEGGKMWVESSLSSTSFSRRTTTGAP